MGNFVTNINIEKLRHLKGINITLSQDKMQHLILTGKNGSGKTSVLDALSRYLNTAASSDKLREVPRYLTMYLDKFAQLQSEGIQNAETVKIEESLRHYQGELEGIKGGLEVYFKQPVDVIRYDFEQGLFVIAYYKADRVFEAETPQHVEKIDLKQKYTISEQPRRIFIKYLLDLKVTEALARNNGNVQKAESIENWFAKFQELLRKIFDDESLELIFEEDTFRFLIKEKNRELFDFNTLSSGFAAVLDIVLDIIVRMEKMTKRSFDFTIPGIVLIDEIETHLHLELQKTVLQLLTSIFPNIQFIVSTHSPFVLNSLEDVTIYDLENHVTVEHGLANVPYEGIVEGYFRADAMSHSLKKKYERYRQLVTKEQLSDDDFEEIAKLEMYLNEIPDYLALGITTEYQRMKSEFEAREDV